MGGDEKGYNFKPGGSLKFKGGEKVASGSSSSSGDKKKKKKKSSSSSSSKSSKIEKEAALQDVDDPDPKQKRTDAELRFEKIQNERRKEKIRKQASKSHKDRVGEFNKYLEGLSEHHDIPKVGPG
ncbi:unnamed protein product [Sympodiomycopsis kandeliae]